MVDFTLYTYKKKKKKKKKKRERVCVCVSDPLVFGCSTWNKVFKILGSQPNNTKSSPHLTSRVCHTLLTCSIEAFVVPNGRSIIL